METQASLFNFPSDIILEVLSYLPSRAVVRLASVDKRSQNLFIKNGYYRQLLLKMGLWNVEDSTDQSLASLNAWKDEYRIVSYYADKIQSNRILPWKMIVNLDNEPVPELMEEVVRNHFRYNPAKSAATPGQSSPLAFQSELPLYPIPIGSCNIGYFEYEVIRTNPQDMSLSIGVGLERYGGLPGGARNSYAYNATGFILLAIELNHITAPSFGKGDIVGCGINFDKGSIFFTKNGEFISEHSKDHYGNKLLDLKSLHGVISCEFEGSEWKVNFGATPFLFDILKYQQLNRQADNNKKRYSSLIQNHLLCYSDQETYEYISKNGTYYGIPDNNPLPDSCKDLTLLQHLFLHSYGGADKIPQEVIQLYFLSSFFKLSAFLLHQWVDDPEVDKFLNNFFAGFYSETENLTTKQKLEEIFAQTRLAYAESVIQCINQTEAELTACAFKSENNTWAIKLLAFNALFKYPKLPIAHPLKQVLIEYLLQVFNIKDEYITPPFTADHLQYLVSALYSHVIQVQGATLLRVIQRKNALKAELRKKYLDEAKRIIMSPKFDADVQNFLQSIPMPWNKFDFPPSLRIATALRCHNYKLSDLTFKAETIVYGLFALKFDPTCFNLMSTAESDFYIEVARGLEPIATNEVMAQYLTEVRNSVAQTDEVLMSKAYFDAFAEPFFNFKFPGNNPKQKLLQFLEDQIKKLTPTSTCEVSDPKVEQTSRQVVTSESSGSIVKTLLIGAASVGLIVTIGAVFWMRSKRQK